MKYEYWKSSASREKIAQGEGYTTKEACLHAISLVKSSKDAPENEMRSFLIRVCWRQSLSYLD